MFHIEALHELEQEDFYQAILEFAQNLMMGEENAIANMANIASLLYHTMKEINWVGFYLYDGKELVLGPFHGKPACIRIPLGKGVCGTAAASKKVQRIVNVHDFEGHIACDAASQSEIVIPMVFEGKLIGVLDIDSPIIGRFLEKDEEHLSQLTKKIIDQCKWEGIYGISTY